MTHVEAERCGIRIWWIMRLLSGSMKIGMLLVTLTFSGSVMAASIQKCSIKEKSCDIKLEEGLVGDTVSVLNDRAQPVATGWIVKRDGNFGTIKFKEVFRDVKRGFPVIVNVDNRGRKERGIGSRV